MTAGTERELRRPQRWLSNRVQRHGLRPRYAAYAIVSFWTIAVIVFGVVERLADPKTFHNVWQGIWWAVETVTTVGYGDIVPDQTLGKVIAGLLMLGGLSLLAVATATITSGFVTRTQDQRRAAGNDPVMKKLQTMTAQLEQLQARLDQLQKNGDPIRDPDDDA